MQCQLGDGIPPEAPTHKTGNHARRDIDEGEGGIDLLSNARAMDFSQTTHSSRKPPSDCQHHDAYSDGQEAMVSSKRSALSRHVKLIHEYGKHAH
jgi:hypothetical protein